jgi:hypothetical protein
MFERVLHIQYLISVCTSRVRCAIVFFFLSFFFDFFESNLLSFIACSALCECSWNTRHTLILESTLPPPLAASPSTSPSLLHLQIPHWSNSRFFLLGSLRLQKDEPTITRLSSFPSRLRTSSSHTSLLSASANMSTASCTPARKASI